MKFSTTILDRLKLAFSDKAANKFAQQVINQYEAGQRYDSRRSYVHGWVRDAKDDADVMTRLEILRKARYWERNSGILNRIVDLFEQYTVGANGLRFVPASSDPKWNAANTTWWNDWQQYPDLNSLQSFGTIQSLIARSWAIDGEVFCIKTRGKVRQNERSFPRIQLVETQRVSTPPEFFGDSNIIDGIRVDDNGRPIFYYVRSQKGDVEKWDPIPADQMVHIFEPTRPGMYRGLSLFYAVLNDLHDLDDLQLLCLDGAKESAAITNIIKTKSGELNMQQLRALRFAVGGTSGTSGGSSQNRTKYYEDVFKGRAKVLQKDDEFEQFAPTRPSQSEQQLWDYLTSKVCAGFGISKMLVFPYSVQGTVVRADLDSSAAFFRSRSAVLANKLSEIYEYVTSEGANSSRLLANRPGDWKKVKVRAPRGVNVDVGRNSTALIAEYEAGWRTLEGICGELGDDWVETLEQRSAELVKAREIEIRDQHPEGTLVRSVLEALKQKADQEAALEAAKTKQLSFQNA